MWNMNPTPDPPPASGTPTESKAAPKESDPQAKAFLRAVAIMARLRAPGGCPWDREQTFDSIRRHTLEEVYEVLDAIERKDWMGLKDELGDLFLQVLFYAEMAQEAGHFTLQDVMDNLCEKLVRRHPHVFANREGVDTSAQVLRNWEEIKESERAGSSRAQQASMLDDVPRSLPALMEATKLGSKASLVGFDWNSVAPVFDKLQEELDELRQAIASGRSEEQESELGDVLFTVVNLARKLGVQSELALRTSNAKFRRRFAAMEASASPASSMVELPPDELERLWDSAKAHEREDRAGE
jgi:nucleoside triphosphate diphosphatase